MRDRLRDRLGADEDVDALPPHALTKVISIPEPEQASPVPR